MGATMAMNDIELIRLYLRDQSQDDPRFSDEDIQELYEGQGSVEGAAALGWLLIAAEAGGESISSSIGNSSESYGQPTERYKVAMAMHQYWKSQIPSAYQSGLWWEMVPSYDQGTGGIVAEIYEHYDWIKSQWLSDSPLPTF